jgi:nucleotide-binding universal stress UspA family protein
MLDIQRIVCAVDFSDISRRGLDLAASLARWYEARISVVHVYSVAAAPAAFAPGDLAVVAPIAMSAVERDLLMHDLSAFVAPVNADAAPLELRLAEGTPWREIVGVASATHADLLVMGTHGRSGFERLLLGSVAEKVLRTAPCPVLTVPPAADVDSGGPMLFKRILFATDFSRAAEAAGEWAASLAREADAELIVLHVLESSPAEVEGFPRSALAAYRREYEQWSATQLHASVPDALRANCAVRELMAAGSPHREVVRVAGEHGCDLVVMGVAGHRGLGDRVFGSTTQHVVRVAPCPVLSVRE